MNNNFNGYNPTWCPGCGNWGIGAALKNALSEMNLDPSSVAVSFGIGCSGNMNDFLNAYGFHGLHGRGIPVAIGMKIANYKMPVIVIAGDGDTYGEGGNHFLHACRGNHDITVIIHDNHIYGLTTGQASPTSIKGFVSKSTPNGIIETAINPLVLALTQGATFIAQTYSGNPKHMAEIIKAGVTHKGFSLINVLQPCVTFNIINGYQYYSERAYQLEQGYDKENYETALKKSLEYHQEKYPLGILYQTVKPCFHEQLPQKSERYTDFGALTNKFI